MEAFNYAKIMEKDGEKFYRELSAAAESVGLKKILDLLAEAEVGHYNRLSEMERGVSPQLAATNILTDAKNVFTGMQSKSFDPKFSYSQVEVYKQALEIEEKSIEFYKKTAAEMKSSDQRDLFLRLAEEERSHYFLVDNILEFMLRPFRWLENAEFIHLDEY